MSIKGFISGVCMTLGLCVAVLGIVCIANMRLPLPYLIDIFTLPVLAGAAVLTLLFLLIRQPRAFILSLFGVALLIVAMIPQAFPSQGPADPQATPVKVMFGNLYMGNPQPERVLAWLDVKKPDIAAFVEVNAQDQNAFYGALHDRYPYVEANADMVIASHYPLSDISWRKNNLGLMSLTAKTAQGPLYFTLAHLTRPWPFTHDESQSDQFDRLTAALQPIPPSRVIVVGDFNTTPSAALLGEFSQSLDLHAAPAVIGTWKSDLPGILRVNIDNMLASSDLNISKREIGPFNGSDHRPVYAEFRPVKAE
jgi:endonuclease/exonuclease/phosphatase (EEP) superfamily protein YafD